MKSWVFNFFLFPKLGGMKVEWNKVTRWKFKERGREGRVGYLI
jgi:hypothetical protein